MTFLGNRPKTKALLAMAFVCSAASKLPHWTARRGVAGGSPSTWRTLVTRATFKGKKNGNANSNAAAGGGNGNNNGSAAGLGGSILGSGLWLLGGGTKAYAARTAGHAGGNVFKRSGGGKIGSGSGTGPKRLGPNRRGGGQETIESRGDGGRKLLASSKRPGQVVGRKKETTLMSILPLLLFAGVVGYGIYSSSNDKSLINVGGGEKGYSVAQIQLGLLGSARLVQRDLDKIAMSADTNSRNGLYSLMQDSVIALIRNPEYWVYGNTQGKRTNSQNRCESYFNQFEMQERQKFEVETQSNVQGKKGKREWKRPEKDWKTGGSYTNINELIVVTLIVALEEDIKLPKIASQEDMKVALNRLGSVRASSILAVELFWTPQDPDDVYTQEELITEYPEMQLI